MLLCEPGLNSLYFLQDGGLEPTDHLQLSSEASKLETWSICWIGNLLDTPVYFICWNIITSKLHKSSANSRAKYVCLPVRFARSTRAYERTKPMIYFTWWKFSEPSVLRESGQRLHVAESLCRNQYTFVTAKVQVLVMILFSVLSLFGFYGFNL